MAGSTDTLSGRARRALLEGERGRRLVHASGSVLPALSLVGVPWQAIRGLFVAGSLVAVVLEAFRLRGHVQWRIFEYLTREYEQETVAGYVLYALSSAAVVVVFDPQIGVPAVLMLTLGDPISGLIASDEFRRVKRPRTMAAMFLVCTVIALPFVYEAPLAVALGALGGMVADGVKPVVRGHVVDDNLTIPPLAAAGLFAGLELTAATGLELVVVVA